MISAGASRLPGTALLQLPGDPCRAGGAGAGSRRLHRLGRIGVHQRRLLAEPRPDRPGPVAGRRPLRDPRLDRPRHDSGRHRQLRRRPVRDHRRPRPRRPGVNNGARHRYSPTMRGMYSDAVIHHALNLERAGSVDRQAAVGEAGNTTCGDHVRIEFELADGRITAARHRSFGCPHATAAAALLCALVEGRTPLEAAAVGMPDVEAGLGGSATNRECLLVAVDALCSCVAGAIEAAPVTELDPRRVAVAMSGGVDSAVALLKVREAGFEPVGVTLRLWIDPAAPDSERACCSPQSVRAARSACHALGVAARRPRSARRLQARGGRRVRLRVRRRAHPQPVRSLQQQLPLRCSRQLRRPGRRRPHCHRPLRPRRSPRRARAGGPRRGRQQGSVVHACPRPARDPGPHLVSARGADQARDP